MRGLFVATAITMAGVSSVFGLMAELEDAYGIAQRDLGWIAGSVFLGALITQLWLARYADRGHGELLLRAGVVAAVVGLLWFGLASELWQFVLARGLLGAGVGMMVPAARRAIIVGSHGDQGERLGMFYAAYLAGFVFGPPVAGVLTELFGVRVPFLVLGGVVAMSLVAIRDVEVPGAASTGVPGADKGVLLRLLASRRMIAALLVVLSFRYSVGVFESLWAVHLDRLGSSTIFITLSLTGFALPMLLVARSAGRLSDRYGARITSVLSALATVPLMASYGYITSIPVLMAFVVPHGLLEAVQVPGSQAAVANAASQDDAASAQGLAEASGSVASIAGALTAAPMYAAFGAGTSWAVGGATMMVLLTLSAVLDRPRLQRPGSPPGATVEPASRELDAPDGGLR
jgi:MFS family permease